MRTIKRSAAVMRLAQGLRAAMVWERMEVGRMARRVNTMTRAMSSAMHRQMIGLHFLFPPPTVRILSGTRGRVMDATNLAGWCEARCHASRLQGVNTQVFLCEMSIPS